MVVSRQVNISSFHRDAWVEIDLSAIEHNVSTIRSWLKYHIPDGQNGLAGGNPIAAKLMAVVKSDAYGHGATQVADLLSASGAEYLGVASIDEGCQLRAGGIKAPILILSPTPSWAIDNSLEDELELTIAASKQARDIDKIARKHGRKAKVHLKIDSGMHRLGVAPSKAASLVEEISQLANLELVSVFSHLARAGDEATTAAQLRSFKQVLENIKPHGSGYFTHIASSEAARKFPDTHLDMVRVGLYLYGLEGTGLSETLTPAMSVKGRINHVNNVKVGETVGYNLTWEARRDSRLACIPIGYADGVDRRLSNRIEGILMGRKIRQVGLISMDQMLFDITDVPEAQDGDVITLIGMEDSFAEKSEPRSGDLVLQLATWAEMLDTITYELACRLRARLPRIYTRAHKGAGGSTASAEMPAKGKKLSSERPR